MRGPRAPRGTPGEHAGLTAKPLRRSTGQQGLVATIGLALFLQEYLRLLQGTQPKWIGSFFAGPIALVRADEFTVTVTPIALVLAVGASVVSLMVLAILRFSAFGRNWRATSDDPVAAALFGIDPKVLSLKTFSLACESRSTKAGFPG